MFCKAGKSPAAVWWFQNGSKTAPPDLGRSYLTLCLIVFISILRSAKPRFETGEFGGRIPLAISHHRRF
jgi:hypothetical protein